MLFNSWQFLILFPAVTLGFYLLPVGARRWWLLASSAACYMAYVPAYIAVALGIILLTFVAARRIERASPEGSRRWTRIGVAGTLAVLAGFKYMGFLAENALLVAGWSGAPGSNPFLAIVVPLGLSFQTFQALSYLFEVRAGRISAERSLPNYALYILFFPLQVAGPIERPQHLLPQLALDTRFDVGQLTSALKLIAWGLFKKMVLADRLALVVDPIFAAPANYSGPQLLCASGLFAFQIYYDFSGYTDVARGAARAIGIDLHFNFNRPYAARFVGDFWGRWHVSLTSWLRDYLYAPLAGRRPKTSRRLAAVWAVFLASGLWHGAAWHFVCWGGLHAVYLSAGTATARWRSRAAQAIGLARVPRLHAALKVITTFGLISYAWVLFRSPDLASAWEYTRRLGDGWTSLAAANVGEMGVADREPFLQLMAAVAIVEMLSWLDSRARASYPLEGRWAPLRAAAYAGLVIGLLEFSAVRSVPFMYVRF